MKKFSLFLLVLVAMLASLVLTAVPARAASLITFVDARFIWGKSVVFIFDATGYKNRDVREATIFVGSNFHDLGCTVNKEEEKIVCIGLYSLTDYAGQTGILHLAGQIFYVPIPEPTLLEEQTAAPLVCGEFETLGADVTFATGGGDTYTMFVPGSNRSEIQKTAQSYVDGSDFVGVLSIGELYCSSEIPA
jgi:hypothetical protein